MRWLRIIALAILACLVLIAAVGFIYEQIGRARDRRLSSARIGQPYSVHGHSMNLYCSGSGSPTVVFESGGNAPGYSWLAVQPKVARFTRACWYDRAGVGWSDSPATVRTSASIADDLTNCSAQRASTRLSSSSVPLSAGSIRGSTPRASQRKWPGWYWSIPAIPTSTSLRSCWGQRIACLLA